MNKWQVANPGIGWQQQEAREREISAQTLDEARITSLVEQISSLQSAQVTNLLVSLHRALGNGEDATQAAIKLNTRSARELVRRIETLQKSR